LDGSTLTVQDKGGGKTNCGAPLLGFIQGFFPGSRTQAWATAELAERRIRGQPPIQGGKGNGFTKTCLTLWASKLIMLTSPTPVPQKQ